MTLNRYKEISEMNLAEVRKEIKALEYGQNDTYPDDDKGGDITTSGWLFAAKGRLRELEGL